MPGLDFLESSQSASLTIAIVGMFSVALASAERLVSARDEAGQSRLRRFAIYFVAIATLGINVVLHWSQYSTVATVAAKERKKLESELALSLWAYTNKEVVALKYLASNHKYMLGYHYFRQGEAALAERTLKEAIDKGSFVAPSNYILAVMARQQNDLGNVGRHVEAALAYDPEYSSAYLERGMLHALRSEIPAALDDVEKAVALSAVHCYSINRNSMTLTHPLSLLQGEPRFERLRKACDSLEKGL